jgi:hypothetical protein
MSAGTVSVPGAAYEEFELEEFSFKQDEEGAFSFQFATKEVPRKRRGKGSDEEEEEEDEDEEGESDWTSKVAWDNYGPSVDAEFDFGSLTPEEEVNFAGKLPVKATFGEDTTGIHCCDHQEAVQNELTFSARNKDGTFALTWTGRICMDGDEEKTYPFTIHATRARLVKD